MRPLSPMLRYFILFVCVGFPLAAARGQTPNAGGLRVVVKETQDLPVAGANCSLSAVPPGQTPIAAATSDEQGTARFTNVARGRYTLTVAKEGFETFARSDVIIDEKPENQIVVVLTVAAVREKVTVTAPSEAATSVETGSTIASGNIKRETLRSLPLAVARVDQALPLIPGVIRSTKGELSIKGASEAQSALLVNGVNSNDPATGNFRLNLPIDSVEAVQVFQHPYTGEFGKFIGGLTRIETRRGGDRWHFELNDFLPDLRFKGGKLVGIAEDQPRLNFNGPLVADATITRSARRCLNRCFHSSGLTRMFGGREHRRRS